MCGQHYCNARRSVGLLLVSIHKLITDVYMKLNIISELDNMTFRTLLTKTIEILLSVCYIIHVIIVHLLTFYFILLTFFH